MKKNSKSRSPVCTRSSISILGDNQADYVNESSSVASTTTKGKESIAGILYNMKKFISKHIGSHEKLAMQLYFGRSTEKKNSFKYYEQSIFEACCWVP